jgi:hypothetical protein
VADAPSLIRRFAWPLAAAVAAAFLASLALQGERPEPGLTRFKAAGVLTAFAPEAARDIAITGDGKTWHLRREGGAWQPVATPQPLPADAGTRIDTALRLLRDAAPMRRLSAEEVAVGDAADYALGPTALRVRVDGPEGASFAIRFGARNPLGSSRYAQVGGEAGVTLLPAYVAEAWEQAIGVASP